MNDNLSLLPFDCAGRSTITSRHAVQRNLHRRKRFYSTQPG